MSEPKFKSPSYDPNACCHDTDCWAASRSTAEQPCWGPVEACAEETCGDEDWYWVHGCQGHFHVYDGGDYEPELK